LTDYAANNQHIDEHDNDHEFLQLEQQVVEEISN
jgi:hypothetical protein